MRHITKKMKREIGIASDVVEVKGEDPAISCCLREDRVGRYVGDSYSWACPPLARSRGLGKPGTDSPLSVYTTKQHTHRHMRPITYGKIMPVSHT